MKDNKTQVVLLIDRSGSMSTIKNDMEGAIKELITQQQKEPGECLVSTYLFDDRFETAFENRDIQQIEAVSIQPRGNTALVDALGKTISLVGQQLNQTDESDKPSKVIFVVVTDGEENASRKLQLKDVKNAVEHQREVYKWEFIFLGSNQDAVLSGQSFGFLSSRSITFSNNGCGTTGVFQSLSSGMSCIRSGNLYSGFSLSERALSNSENLAAVS